MLSFSRPSQKSNGGHKLPMPIKSLDKMGVALRRSEVSMIAGVPGSGKSSLALKLAVYTKAPTLYIAADTSEWTMRIRAMAMLSGAAQAECESRLDEDANNAWFNEIDHIAWSFDAAPSLDSIRLEIDAYAEVHGVHPELVVVDNLIDVAPEGSEGEFTGLRNTMKELKKLSRATDSSVLVLHHTSEDRNIKILHAPPRHAIHGKVAQLPALVLTVDNNTANGRMAVGIVKNRYGMANPNGSYGPALNFDAARMQITDQVQRF